MRSRWLAVGVALAALFGCAQRSNEARVRDAAHDERGAARFGVTNSRLAVAEGDQVVGIDSALTRSEKGARGTLFGHLVEVTWTGERLGGQIDGRPAQLTVTAEQGSSGVRGRLGPLQVDLQVGGDGVEGYAGRCRYELQRVEDGFVGTTSCKSALFRDLAVAFPAELQQRPLPEQITYLALALNAAETRRGEAPSAPRAEVDASLRGRAH